MAQKADTTPTPPEVETAATANAELPLLRPALIGTFVKAEGSMALIRTATGTVRKVVRGDRIGQARVTAIGMGSVTLSLMGEVHELTIPGGA